MFWYSELKSGGKNNQTTNQTNKKLKILLSATFWKQIYDFITHSAWQPCPNDHTTQHADKLDIIMNLFKFESDACHASLD